MSGLAVAWRGFLSRNVLPLLIIVGIGTLLAAVQLVPTQQLSALSPRAGGLTFPEAAAFSLDPRVLPRALLPTFGQDAELLSEYVGWVGFVGVALAVVGVLGSGVTKGRDFGILAAGTGLLLAFGGYTPLFWLLWRIVPGFDLFRAPARWLLLWSLGIAVLAGLGLSRKDELGRMKDESRHLSHRFHPSSFILHPSSLILLIGAATILLFLFLLFGAWPPLDVLPWWMGAMGVAVVAIGARWMWPVAFPVPYGAVVVGLMLLELWVAAWGLDYQEATAPEAYEGLRPVPAHLITVQPELGVPRLLSLSDLTWDPGDLAALEARYAGLLGEEAIYDFVVAMKLKEVLAPNQPMRWDLLTADGYGGGLLPTARWVEFQRTLPLAEIVPDGRLREQLTRIPRRALLDVMGVEWLVADKVLDWWNEDIFHDLGAPLLLDAGDIVQWESDFSEATAFSFIVIGEWPDEPGTVTLDGRPIALEEAEERAIRETPRGIERHMFLALDPPSSAEEITLAADDI
ncbi:MAG: hypothetical protein M3220_16500, partial [Chloroflexota bacterium]|nr:hypothetical protein [Chloroflexota bacterium]